MDALEFNDVLNSLRERRAASLAQVEQFDVAIAGLELAQRLVRQKSRSGPPAEHGKLTEAVRGFVAARPGVEFTVNDVEIGLRETASDLNGDLNRDSITKVLRRLVRDGKVNVLQKGRGRREGVYASAPVPT